MILISHRGNLYGRIPERENSESYIDEAIDIGYAVEMDVWIFDNKVYLGHDNPQYLTSVDWLLDREKHLWVHTKNIEALSLLINTGLRTFYHSTEHHTIINNCNIIWSDYIKEAKCNSIIPMMNDLSNIPCHVFGVCSDIIGRLL